MSYEYFYFYMYKLELLLGKCYRDKFFVIFLSHGQAKALFQSLAECWSTQLLRFHEEGSLFVDFRDYINDPNVQLVGYSNGHPFKKWGSSGISINIGRPKDDSGAKVMLWTLWGNGGFSNPDDSQCTTAQTHVHSISVCFFVTSCCF